MLPDFSVLAATGSRKTSVPTDAGSGPWGSAYQQLADSVSKRSRTTSQRRLRSASRSRRAFGPETPTFWPKRKAPSISRRRIFSKSDMYEKSPEILGSQS